MLDIGKTEDTTIVICSEITDEVEDYVFSVFPNSVLLDRNYLTEKNVCRISAACKGER